MRISTALSLAACALVLLPLAGCGTSDAPTPKKSSVDDSATSTDDSTNSTEALTEKITAANEEGNAEVTIMGPESWYSWGPGDVVNRGRILSTTTELEDRDLGVWVNDGWPYACTPENLATKQCDTRSVEYESYETLEPITIDGYQAPGFEHVQDFDDYKTRTQSRLLDVDGAPVTVIIWTTKVDEDFPQVLYDIRDSLTIEFVD